MGWGTVGEPEGASLLQSLPRHGEGAAGSTGPPWSQACWEETGSYRPLLLSQASSNTIVVVKQETKTTPCPLAIRNMGEGWFSPAAPLSRKINK